MEKLGTLTTPRTKKNKFSRTESMRAILYLMSGAGVAYTSGVYCLRRGSDGHLNPAVTVALTFLQRLSTGRCASFLAAQFFG